MGSRRPVLTPRELWPPEVADAKPGGAEERRAWERRRRKMAGIEHFKSMVEEAIPGLFTTTAPKEPIAFGEPGLKNLLGKLERADPVAYRSWHCILRAGLSTAAKRDWYSGPLPQRIIRLRPLGSPLTPVNFGPATRVDNFRRVLLARLPSLGLNQRDALAGAILTCAVVYGGLLDPELLYKLAGTPSIRLRGYGLWHWIELTRADGPTGGRGRRGAASRRWILDPLTASLLLRRSAIGQDVGAICPKCHADPRHAARTIWALIRPVIEQVDPTLARELGSLAGLLRGTELALRLHLPPILVNFAKGTLTSWSLPEHAWLRLISGKHLGPDSVAAEPEVPPPPIAFAPTADGHGNRKHQYRILARMLKVLRAAKGDRGAARAGLAKVLHDTASIATPITITLLKWSIARMTRAGGALKPSAVDRYMVAVARPLLDFLGARSLGSLAAEDWADVYESVRDTGRTPAEMGLRAGLCAQIHSWLSSTGIAPFLDVAAEIGAGISKSNNVDANLVTPAEYFAALGLLAKMAAEGEPYAQAAALLIRIGYRFGPRLSEQFALHVRDLPIVGNRFDVIIRRGKSVNARRMLPSEILPRTGETAAIAAALTGKMPDAWLFSEPGNPTEPINQQAVIDLVTWVLRRVSGDSTLHIHHLRHSHLTLITFVLLPSALLGSRLPGESHKHKLAEAITTRANELRMATVGAFEPTRRSAFAVALDAGHASPAVGVYSYIHLLDVALFAALRANLERYLSPSHLAALLGIPQNQVPVLRQRKRVDSESELLPQRVLALNKNLRAALVPVWSNYPATDMPPRSYLRNIVRCLNELQCGATPEQVSNRFGFDVVRVRRWYDSARAIAEMTGPRRQGVVPRRPRAARATLFPINLPPAEWLLAERTQGALARLLQLEDSAWVREMVGLGLTQGAGGHGDLWFHDPARAQCFLTFLRKLGVADHELRFLHYPRDGDDAQSADGDRADWARKLGIPPAVIWPVPRKTSQKRSHIGVLGIQVAAPNEQALLERRQKAKAKSLSTPATPDTSDAARRGRQRLYGSTGFWLGLRLGALLCGAVPDATEAFPR
jgi:hypothetical protein